jgi:transposase
MKLHGSAALSWRQRRRPVVLVGSGMSIAAAAAIVGCSRQAGSKWVGRHRRGEGLEDRSSRPHHSPRRADDRVERAVLRASVELQAGPHVIGWATGIAASTVHAILRRHGCSRLKPPLPREAIVRYRPQDSPVSAADKRESRATRPHTARALGLRLHLHHRSRARPGTARRARLLQSLPTTPRPRRADATSARQRPIWDEQLDQPTLRIVDLGAGDPGHGPVRP